MQEKLLCNLYFYGGVGSVTGANFILESQDSEHHKAFRLMVDCGLTQGSDEAEKINREDFAYDPATVDALILTHAHIDHIGRVPKLIADGFSGTIHSTRETKELAALMFEDALSIMAHEKQKRGIEPLYGRGDVQKVLSLWHACDYYDTHTLGGGFAFSFKDAGHILGSGIAEVTYNGTMIAFTGDLGNSPSPLLRDTEFVTDATYVVMESVYGDRHHEDVDSRATELKRVVEETVERGGTLLIPAFSLERTQEMLFELNNLIESGVLPEIPVYLDSPLAIRVTEVYRSHAKNFKDSVKKQIAGGDDIFAFPKLKFTQQKEESKEINQDGRAKIIIAGAGMSHAGRIMFHEERYLDDSANTILFVGYQSPGSLGRAIQEGQKKVKILGKDVRVRARIETIFGYSGHRDTDGLLEFAEKTAEHAQKIFVAMGEPKSSLFLAQRIRDFVGVEAIVPEKGSKHVLEF